MEEGNVDRRRREESPFPICFQTNRGRSFADRLYVIFVVATLPPVVIALSIVIVFGVIGLPLLSGCAVVSVVAVLTLEISWKWILSRPKCCIVFYADHLQVGGSLTQFAFSYDQVEIISLPVARAQGSWIRLKCGNRIVRVHLVGRERWNCLWLLRRCCRNAVFADERGREHLPANPVEIDQTLNALKGHHKRRISVCVGGGLFCAGMFFVCAGQLVLWWNGNIQPNGFDLAHLAEMAGVFGVATIIAIVGAAKSRRTLARIRQATTTVSDTPDEDGRSIRDNQ